jgi:hypothetical protein
LYIVSLILKYINIDLLVISRKCIKIVLKTDLVVNLICMVFFPERSVLEITTVNYYEVMLSDFK